MAISQFTPIAFAIFANLGCRQIAGLDDPLAGDAGGATDDGLLDAPASDATDAPPIDPVCYGSGLVQTCLEQRPTGTLTLTTQTINTDTSPLCATNVASGGTGLCIVAAETITIESGNTVRGVGSKPLVLIADDLVTIAGTLDVASHRDNDSGGSGSSFSGCNAGTAPGSGGGGAGGSFAGTGGAGGTPSAGTAGPPLAAPTTLHGGCQGRDGGGSDAGKRGKGGGATYAIAGSRIEIPGQVNASGAGADNGDPGISGGGGGGSGGMIGFDAPTIDITGLVFANGGGGGEGNDATVKGESGGDPSNALGGVGGDGSSTGGGGGSGAAGATLGGATGAAGTAGVSGGGGGGGGAGVIKLFGTRTGGGTVSPAAS